MARVHSKVTKLVAAAAAAAGVVASSSWAADAGVATHDWSTGVPASLYTRFGQSLNATAQQIGGANLYPTNGASQTSPLWALQAPYNNWVTAFFPGELWQMYNRSVMVGDESGAAWWLSLAKLYTSGLVANENNTGTHDVGFMTVPGFLPQYLFTNNETAADILVTTANSLAQRFVPTVGAFESWGAIHPANHAIETIIDNMLNLELPFWVSSHTGNTTLYDMAVSHTNRMVTDIFQPAQPGCVWHLITCVACLL